MRRQIRSLYMYTDGTEIVCGEIEIGIEIKLHACTVDSVKQKNRPKQGKKDIPKRSEMPAETAATILSVPLVASTCDQNIYVEFGDSALSLAWRK